MGLDAHIWFRATTEPELFDLRATQRVCAADPGLERTPRGATHELDLGGRYWSPDSRRGDWPDLCAILMALIADKDVEAVWYGHDCNWHTEVTPALILEYSAAYMGAKAPAAVPSGG